MKVRIVESSNNVVLAFKRKLRLFIKELSPEEQGLMASVMKRPTTTDLLNFCGEVRDKIDGKDDDEALKLMQFKANQRKDRKLKS